MKTGVNRRDGPMMFLAEIIVKRMERAGYPSKIYTFWRSVEDQNEAFRNGHSKARGWHSPHQFGEAVDIAHKGLAWHADREYWEMLNIIARNVAQDYDVDLIYGYDWGWDKAHLSLKSWRDVKKAQQASYAVRTAEAKQYGKEHSKAPERVHVHYRPTELDLLHRFQMVLKSEAPEEKPQGQKLAAVG